ncbi:unnamed protein product, partial [Mesorhabditis belari]|uniref:Calponin-homology (CH) domain-containing protein n=1 Tax=Mesorhabditis belari TaxID=2138241 RepID=A0AAF3FQ71_9BILA
MSGTWSRKRRSANVTTTNGSNKTAIVAPQAATSSTTNAWDPLRDHIPLPAVLQKQQQLLSRSTDRMFDEAQATGVLNLVGRKLKEFPQGLANKYDISDLVSADLSSNRLAELPAGICELRCLESLRVRANVLRRIPSDVALLDRLTFLDLSNNHLTQIPLGLFDLPIEILLLSGNRLDTVPKEIRQLSSTLTELDISYNHLRTLPADIALLKFLRVLNLRKNQLDQFPSELCRLTLNTLDLSSNYFTQIPLHIRKMKTLFVFMIDDNPLQSPPAKIINKGREHVFKWMDLECGGGMGHRSAYSTGTLRSHNIGRTQTMGSDDSDTLRKPSTSAPVIERKNRQTRFATLTSGQGSDSGYASTADEHRLSHELPSSGLDDITEISVFSPSSDERLDEVEKKKSQESPMDTISSSSNDSTSSFPICPINTTKRSIHEQNQKKTPQTLSKVQINVTPPKLITDLKNNNVEKKTIAQKKVVSTMIAKPVSKVAPLQKVTTMENGNLESLKSNKNKMDALGKNVRPVPPPTRPSTLTRQTVTGNMIGVKKTLASVPIIKAGTLSNSIRSVGSTSSSIRPTVKPPSTPTTLPKTTTDRKSLVKSMSTESTSTSQFIEGLRKAFKERLGVSLDSENIPSQLSDGVYLCNFANSLKGKSITVLTPIENLPLSSPKAKRNVDSFVATCKKLGVPEASLCNSADIMGKRNLLQIAKTIMTLHRNFPNQNRIIEN